MTRDDKSENSRPRGAVAVTLDPDVLLKRARARLARADDGFIPASLGHGPLPQMLFAADRGNATVVNGECDGALENVDGEIEVWFSREGTPVSVPLTLEDINDSATEATLDLADGILALNDEADAMHEHWFRRYDADHRPS